MKTLLKNATLVTLRGQQKADLLIDNEEGRLIEISDSISEEGVETVIDCTGKHVLPGVIDPHVHLRVPGAEQKEDWDTGTAAAAAGGVTTILDMPNNSPAVTTREILNKKRELVEGKSCVDYGLYMGATVDQATGQTNVDEYLASDAVALKIYMGSSTGDLLVHKHEWVDQIFEKAAEAGRIVCVHAEDEALIRENSLKYTNDDPTVHPKIRDDEVAHRAVKAALEMAQKHGSRLHICHLSTKRGLDEFVKFKSDRISCEVTPHHVFLDQSELVKQGNFAKMNPPLRLPEDNAALIEGIKSGVVNMVATDHAPHLPEEKEQSYSKAPAGVPGLETSLPLLLDAVNRGEFELKDVVRVTSEEPARVFGLKNKGRLDVGMDADLVVVDMSLEQVVENGGPGARFTKCGWSAFAGRTLKGWPVMTFVRGVLAYANGETHVVGRRL
ncbi:MAG: dihydroorotase [Candidatus Peregrinibacteria bacterium]|nr:dihydroorotase [Candidatus Peregrinibacteria bacterium]